MRSRACLNCDGEGSEHEFCSLLDEGKCPNEQSVEFFDEEISFERKSLGLDEYD